MMQARIQKKFSGGARPLFFPKFPQKHPKKIFVRTNFRISWGGAEAPPSPPPPGYGHVMM